MAVINNAVLQAIRTQLSADYQKGFNAVESQYQKITMVIPSSTASNTYGWIGSFAEVREWVGDRVIQSIKEHSYVLHNKKFELTHGVDRTDIEDNELGLYPIIFQGIGQKMAEHNDKLVFNLLPLGFTTPCFDSQYYFDVDHPVNTAHDGSGTDVSVSNIQPGVGTGDPWYLVDGSQPMKPIVYQERVRPEFTAMMDPKDEAAFMSDEFRFGSRKRGNVGFGLWQQMLASRETLDSTNFESAQAQMREFKKDGGEVIGIEPTIIVVGRSNILAAQKLFTKKLLANGEENFWYGKIEIVYSPKLP